MAENRRKLEDRSLHEELLAFMENEPFFEKGLSFSGFCDVFREDYTENRSFYSLTNEQISNALKELQNKGNIELHIKNDQIAEVIGITEIYLEFGGDIKPSIVSFFQHEGVLLHLNQSQVCRKISDFWRTSIPTEIIWNAVLELCDEGELVIAYEREFDVLEGKVLKYIASSDTNVFEYIAFDDVLELHSQIEDNYKGFITDQELHELTPEDLIRLDLFSNVVNYLLDADICIARKKDVVIDPRSNMSEKEQLTQIVLPQVNLEILTYYRNNPKKLLTMDWRKFEELVADIFKVAGFDVTLTPGRKDGGIDIIAVQNSSLTGPLTHLIQCKRYSHNVGVEPIRGLFGVVTAERANHGICVTTSDFTKEAIRFANHNKTMLSLKNYSDLLSWLKEQNLPKA